MAQELMAGKRGLVMGVANDHSIAWGIARKLAEHGAELAFTYQNAAFGKRLAPLAETVGSGLTIECDVNQPDGVDKAFDELERSWDSLDFVVHAIAYSDKNELKGRYVDTSPENFRNTLNISCYSFTSVARRASAMMPNGGSLVTLTYAGSTRVMPNYNVMGVAKAALEASVRYIAADLGPDRIRVNAISAGPMRTLAGAVIGDARYVFGWTRDHSPLRRNIELDEVGGAALYFLSDLSTGVTGEIHHVDSGYHAIGIPVKKNGGLGEPEDA
jgi:enoyl-[acyl-carrier protein] reductase I